MIGDIAKMNFCGCLLRRDDHRGGYHVGACVSLRELKAIMVDIGSEAWTYEPCAEGFTACRRTVPGVFAAVRTLEEDAACSGVACPNNNKARQIGAGLAGARAPGIEDDALRPLHHSI